MAVPEGIQFENEIRSFFDLLGFSDVPRRARAGAVIGSSLGGVSHRRVFTRVIVFVVFSVFLTVVLQLSGFALPALVFN